MRILEKAIEKCYKNNTLVWEESNNKEESPLSFEENALNVCILP